MRMADRAAVIFHTFERRLFAHRKLILYVPEKQFPLFIVHAQTARPVSVVEFGIKIFDIPEIRNGEVALARVAGKSAVLACLPHKQFWMVAALERVVVGPAFFDLSVFIPDRMNVGNPAVGFHAKIYFVDFFRLKRLAQILPEQGLRRRIITEQIYAEQVIVISAKVCVKAGDLTGSADKQNGSAVFQMLFERSVYGSHRTLHIFASPYPIQFLFFLQDDMFCAKIVGAGNGADDSLPV